MSNDLVKKNNEELEPILKQIYYSELSKKIKEKVAINDKAIIKTIKALIKEDYIKK